ncbi:hypothetical protein JW721_00945 [Candidatus Micrarchaeota archaeon]|nr:hypothetical protein [Candidatus Micrarchaeota archaeon]
MCAKHRLLTAGGPWAQANKILLPKGGSIRNFGRKYHALACVDACEESGRHPVLARRAARIAVRELMDSAAMLDFPPMLCRTARLKGLVMENERCSRRIHAFNQMAARNELPKTGFATLAEMSKATGHPVSYFQLTQEKYAQGVAFEIESCLKDPSEQLLLAANLAKKYGFGALMKEAAIEFLSIRNVKIFTYYDAMPYGNPDLEFGFGREEYRRLSMKSFSSILRVITDSSLYLEFRGCLEDFLSSHRRILGEKDFRSALVSAAADELGAISNPPEFPFTKISELAEANGISRGELVEPALAKCAREGNLKRAVWIRENWGSEAPASGLR